MLIDGIHIPLTDAFYRDGALYLRKLEHNVRRYSLSPVSGLVTLSPSTEASTLSDAEALEVLTAVSASASREKVLIAGVSRGSVRGAIELARAAEKADFDALLVSAPVDWQTLSRQDGSSALSLYFRAIADATPLPVLLYSNGSGSGFALPVRLIGELSTHSNIVGVYDADLSIERRVAIAATTASSRRDVEVTTVFAPVTRRMKKQESTGPATFVSADALLGGTALATAPPLQALKTRTKSVGFAIMAAGTSSQLVPLLEAGVVGAMPTLASCAPQACFEAYAAFKDGDPALAAEKAARLETADALIADLGVAAVKYGCDLNGYYGGVPRLPRLPLNAENRERVETAMRELRN